VAAETLAVAAALINVQFVRHIGAAQRGRKIQAIFNRHGLILVRAPYKTGRGIFCDVKLGGNFIRQRLRCVRAQQIIFGTLMRKFAHGDDGITKNGCVRTRTLTFDDVGGVGIAGFEKRHCHRSEMPAGGGTDDADAVWIELPLPGARAHEANGARDVLQFNRVMVAIEPEAIFENETGNALAGQPARVTFAFMRREVGVSAARANDHRGAVGGAAGRKKMA